MKSEMLREICLELNIGKIFTSVYNSRVGKLIEDYSSIEVFDSGDADDDKFFEFEEQINSGMTVEYRIHPRKGCMLADEARLMVFSKMMTLYIELDNQPTSIYDKDLGIYNRGFFNRICEKLINDNVITQYACCYFNLKNFSAVNEMLGRDAGTLVMKEFSEKLQIQLGKNGYVCRVGSDNFVVLFLKTELDNVMNYLKGTAVTYDAELNERILVAANSGYYLIDDSKQTPVDIFERVSEAVKIAKENPKEMVAFYDEKIQHQRDYSKRMENSFDTAIENNEFMVYYQPKVKLKKYRLAGAEALCRWKHNGQIIYPNDFIPIFERSSLICILDFYMLEHVCRDIRQWLDEGREVVRISVNLSRRHMGSMNLCDRIVSIIDKYNVPHKYIEIELTETMTDMAFNDMKELVAGLHNAGIRAAVDDFGVGYSSLNLLRQIPWDLIKIDKSFLPEKMNKDSEQYSVLSHLLTMLKGMGFKCIVEGIENVEQIKMLKTNDCYLAQGFYFDKPMPKEEFEKRLDELKAV